MRLIEVYLPALVRDGLDSLLADLPILHASTAASEDLQGQLVVRLLVRAEHSGELLDALEQRFGGDDRFRAILLNVEATLPRAEEDKRRSGEPDTPQEAPRLRFGVSREELYARVLDGTEISQTYILTVVLSAIVVAVGLWRNDLAVIIGAMVIAPLLGPNVAMALATTLADRDLTRKALRTNLAGVGIALAVAVAVGLLFTVDPSVDAIRSRTEVGPGDIVLALAAGCASALAFTTSIPAALIGVMVSVALLPPLVVFGLLAASGLAVPAAGAAMLLLVNVISVNLAGVSTFLWLGVRPRTWWEAKRARGHTWRAIAIWLILLAALIVVMSLAIGE